MAIKAGLVGVNPKGVDKNGMPIGSSANSVDEAQLTANGKKFFFAYDETSEKYGYKLDGAGDFIPFESAGGGPGWVKPAELITTGLNFTGVEYVSGGYYVNNSTVYVDIIIKILEAATDRYVEGLPLANSISHLLAVDNNNVETVAGYDNAGQSYSVNNGTRTAYFYVTQANSEYNHIFGSYK